MEGIPTYSQFIEPVLQALAKRGEPGRARDVVEEVADLVGLTEEQRAARLPSGTQYVYRNRIGWAQDSTKRAGFTDSPAHGVWRLTPEGTAFLSGYPNGIPQDEIHRIANANRRTPMKKLLGEEPDEGDTVSDTTDPDSESPEERIESAIQELNASVAQELLELIRQAPPAFFERLVLEVLHAMGYGATRAALQQVGGAGDGGIDGIISLDRLGLEKVYVQAKRYRDGNVVGRPDVQAFFGALAGRRANKGVFITASAFTREALEFAAHVSDSIVLVDGLRFAKLMIEHGVGVSHKVIKVPKVDSDYFEEG
jgi:restriction system protein